MISKKGPKMIAKEEEEEILLILSLLLSAFFLVISPVLLPYLVVTAFLADSGSHLMNLFGQIALLFYVGITLISLSISIFFFHKVL